MSEAQNCNHDCGSCTANCDSRVPDKKSFEEKLTEGCSVKKVIGVVSGKGGVGKSLVTSMLAVTHAKPAAIRYGDPGRGYYRSVHSQSLSACKEQRCVRTESGDGIRRYTKPASSVMSVKSSVGE